MSKIEKFIWKYNQTPTKIIFGIDFYTHHNAIDIFFHLAKKI